MRFRPFLGRLYSRELYSKLYSTEYVVQIFRMSALVQWYSRISASQCNESISRAVLVSDRDTFLFLRNVKKEVENADLLHDYNIRNQ